MAPEYRHRALWLSLRSGLNSALARNEERRFGAAIEATEIGAPPLFVLGHWGSGTTLLHHLLALDPERAAPNTYQVVNPHTFLTTERAFLRLFGGLGASRRRQDDVPTGFDRPQEDEFALAITTGASVYLASVFPRDEARYARFLAFRDAAPERVEAWKSRLRWFVKKVTLRTGRALVLKSPPHTGKIRALLEVFPEARFVHVHRHPYAVFQSTLNQRLVGLNAWFLQPPDFDDMPDLVLRHHEALYDAFFEQSRELPASRLHHVRFDDLERDPLRAIADVYEDFGWRDFGRIEAPLRRRAPALARHARNPFPDLAEDEKRRIRGAWERSFDAWGYAP